MNRDPDFEAAVRYLAARGIDLPAETAPGLAIGWGEQACRFCGSRAALLATLLPYFREGLERDERCIWQLGAGLSSAAARLAIAGLGGDISPDQVDLVEHGSETDWAREEARALGQGWRGLRIGGEGVHRRDLRGARTRTLCIYLDRGEQHGIC